MLYIGKLTLMKKTSIYLLILVAVSPFFIYTSCKDQNHHAKKECEDVMCTMMFAMVTVEIKDNAGANVALDEAYTIRISTDEKILHDNSTNPGFYTVLDDGYQKQLQNRSDKFQFIGMKNGVKVVDETYTISADCCHVNRETGNTVITLQ
jgi:hypothetical protein